MVELRSAGAGESGLWATDRVMISYLAAMGLLVLVFRDRIPGALGMLGWHALGIAAPAPESMIGSLATVPLPPAPDAKDAPALSVDPIAAALRDKSNA